MPCAKITTSAKFGQGLFLLQVDHMFAKRTCGGKTASEVILVIEIESGLEVVVLTEAGARSMRRPLVIPEALAVAGGARQGAPFTIHIRQHI